MARHPRSMKRKQASSGDAARIGLLSLLVLALYACARPTPDRPTVRTLTLQGVRNVDKHELRHGLALLPTAWWDLRHHREYDELLLDADRERVLRYYRTHGFYNAQIVVCEARPRGDGKEVDVVIAVNEGAPTLVNDLRVVGTSALPSATKRDVDEMELAIRRGQVFVYSRYVGLKDGMLGILKAHGFPWAAIEGDVLVDRASNTAVIRLDLDPGPYSHLGTIDVVPGGSGGPQQREAGAFQLGHTRPMPVDSSLLLDKLGARPGDLFSLPSLEAGRGVVTQLRLFSSVSLFYERDPKNPNLVDVHLRVAEPSLDELRIGGGVGIESQRNEAHLQLLYTRRNFLGGLRTLELRLRPAFVVMPAVWSRIDRYGPAVTSDVIFTQPNPGRLTKLTWDVGYDLGIQYAYQYHGPRTQLAIARLLWHDRLSLSGSYNFQFLDFFDTAPQILSDPARAGAVYGYTDPYRLGWLEEDFTLDLRDDRVEPRKGFYAAASFEQGGEFAGGSFLYEKLLVDARGYAPLGKRVVIAGRAQFGQMFSQGNDSTPITRRLYLGGATTQRGFSEGRLAPQVGGTGGLPVPIGGDQSFLVSLEVRVDLVRLAGNMLSFAGFCDAGDVGRAKGDDVSGWKYGVDWAHLHTAVGGGLRYRTPIGTVRADVGVRLNRVSATTDGRPNPDPGQRAAFHISLAEAF